MKELLIEVDDKNYKFLVQLLKNFDFVHIKDNSEKKKTLLHITRGMIEAHLASKGMVKSRPINELLNEL